MTTEQYQIGYESGYSEGFNAGAADAVQPQATELQGEVKRLTMRLKMTSDTMNGYNLQRAALEAKLDELTKQEPVIDFTVLHQFASDQAISYNKLCTAVRMCLAAPKALEPVALEDEMLDAAISWCDSNGINVLEPEQLSSLVNSLYITVRDAA